MGHVEHSGIIPYRIVFVNYGRILYRHNKAAERAHLSSEGNMPVMKTGLEKFFLFHIES